MSKSTLTELEQAIVAKFCTARFPPYSASKRFARDLEAGHVRQLSDKGRKFLAFVVHKFRRQYRLTVGEQAWVDEWNARELKAEPKEEKSPKTTSAPVATSGDLFAQVLTQSPPEDQQPSYPAIERSPR